MSQDIASAEPNYFNLFDLPARFDVDQALLSERYRQLQRAVHPDRFATASERERLLAIQKAAQINDALATLKSSLRRAEYLLALRGVELGDQQRTYQDPQFLMEQMELREQLAELPDADEPQDALDAFTERVDADIRAQEHAIGEALAAGNSEADWHAADAVRKLKFLTKLHQEALRLEERLY